MHDRIARFTCYLLATSPLWYVHWLLYPAGFGKLPFFALGVTGLAVMVLLLVLRGQVPTNSTSWRSPAGMVRMGMVAVLAVAVVSALLSGNSGLGFWGSQSRQTGVVTLLLLTVYAFALPVVLRDRRSWLRLSEVFLWSASLPAMLAIVEALVPSVGKVFGEAHRFSAWFGNPSFLAGYLVAAVFFSLRLLGALRGVRRAAAVGLMLVCMVGVTLTGSRGGFLALVAGCVVAAGMFLFLRWRNVFQGKRVVIGLVLFVVLVGVGAMQATSGGPLSRIANADVWLRENQPRLMGWQIAWKGFLARPVLGWGTEQFQTVFDRFYNPRLLKFSFYETVSDKPHNAFLEVLATQGAFGGLALLVLLGAVIRATVVGLRQKTLQLGEAASTCGLLVGVTVFSFFLFDILPVLVVWYAAIAFLLAVPALDAAQLPTHKEPAGRQSRWFWLGVTTACFISVGVLLGWAVPASVFTSRALDTQDPAVFLVNSRQALAWGGPHLRENRLNLAYTFIRQESNGQWSEEQAAEEAALIHDSLRRDAWTNTDFTSTFVLGQVLAIAAEYAEDPQQLEEARQAFLHAQELSPGRQVATIQLARAMIMAGNGQDAARTLQELVDAEPDVGETHWYLGLARAAAGQLPEAAEAFHTAISLKRWPRTAAETEYAAGVLNTQQAWDDIIAIYQHVLSTTLREPAPWHAKLAATYAQAGKPELAVMEAQLAAQLDPSFAAEAKAFIDSLQQ